MKLILDKTDAMKGYELELDEYNHHDKPNSNQNNENEQETQDNNETLSY